MTNSTLQVEFTLENVVDWVNVNRFGYAFVGYSYEQLVCEIVGAALRGELLVHSTNNAIDGVGVYERNGDDVYVRNVLCTSRAALKAMSQIRHTCKRISGNRGKHNKKVFYGRWTGIKRQ